MKTHEAFASSTSTPRGAPRVLVLLGTYNGRLWIEDQLQSILDQQSVEVQVCISDDASTDGTWDFLVSRFGRHPAIVLTRSEASSGSAGANFRRLFRLADIGEADYVALADQDDVWLPAKLIRAVNAMRARGAGGYSGAVKAFWPDGRKRVLRQSDRTRAADFLFEGAGQGCSYVVDAAMFRRVKSLITDQPQALSELHYHDWLLYLLARAWSLEWCFDPEPYMCYRQHGGNEIGARDGISGLKRRMALIRSGWYGRQVGAAARIFGVAAGSDSVALDMTARFSRPAPRGAVERLQRTVQVLRHGRRKLGDRLVLACACLMGWL